jgi:hypothetical protein
MSERSDTVIPMPQRHSESDITSSSSSNYFRDKIISFRRGNFSNKSTEAREESYRDHTLQKSSIKEGSGEDRRELSKESKSARGENEEMEKPEKTENNRDAKSQGPKKKEKLTWKRVLLGPSEKPDMSKKSDKVKKEFRRYLAEFHGAFMLVLIHAGIGVVKSTVQKQTDPVTYVPLDAGLGSGLNLIGLIFALGPISGAHFNPAVTTAFFFKRCI